MSHRPLSTFSHWSDILLCPSSSLLPELPSPNITFSHRLSFLPCQLSFPPSGREFYSTQSLNYSIAVEHDYYLWTTNNHKRDAVVSEGEILFAML